MDQIATSIFKNRARSRPVVSWLSTEFDSDFSQPIIIRFDVFSGEGGGRHSGLKAGFLVDLGWRKSKGFKDKLDSIDAVGRYNGEPSVVAVAVRERMDKIMCQSGFRPGAGRRSGQDRDAAPGRCEFSARAPGEGDLAIVHGHHHGGVHQAGSLDGGGGVHGGQSPGGQQGDIDREVLHFGVKSVSPAW